MKRDPKCNPFTADPSPILVEPSLLPRNTSPPVTQPDSSTSRMSCSEDLLVQRNLNPLETATFGHVVGESPASGQNIEENFHDDGGERDYKNWLDFSMLVKLDSMHLLAEWQFQNPMRLRSIMKDDDETAQWVSIQSSLRRQKLNCFDPR